MSEGQGPMFRELPPGEFRLSELPEELDVPSIPDDARTMHTLFAILLVDVDRSDIHGADKMDILQGITQAWTRYAEEQGTEDVVVNHDRMGLETEVVTEGE